MTSTEVTLGEFVQQLLLQIGPAAELRFKDERPWHEFFYELKRRDSPDKPAFFRDMFFDWNGEYPKNRELSEYLHALHWTGCMSAANPSYDQVRLNPDVGELWKTNLDAGLQQFLADIIPAAKVRLAA